MRKVETLVALGSPVVIVDNEIANDLSLVDWDYRQGDVICVGILMGSKIVQFLREPEDDIKRFKQEVSDFLDGLGKTFYAFNFLMEKGNFQGFLDKSYYVQEIKPFKGRGWTKNKFYEELVEDGIVKEVSDPIDSRDVMKCYQNGEYEKILEHNRACCIKEYHIFMNNERFLKKYGDRINEQGWIN